MTCGQLGSSFQRIVRVFDLVMFLETLAQTLQDVDGLRDGGLDDVNLLEAPGQRVILLEDAAIFLICGGTDAADLAVRQHGLDQVRGIHDPAGRGAGADHGVNLIDEQDRTRLFLQFVDHALQPLLEVAAILGAGDQRAHVERVDRAIGQHVRHLVFDDTAGQTLCDSGLADACLTDIERVVLASATEDLNRPLNLDLPPDQRIDLALLGEPIEVGCIFVERAAALRILVAGLGRGIVLLRLVAFFICNLRHAMRDVVDDVQPGHILSAQQIHGVTLLLAENRDQHVGHANFLAAARLHMEHRALQHALETERWLHFTLVGAGQARRGLLDVLFELLAQLGRIGTAGAQHLANPRRLQDGVEQVLDGQELVASLPGHLERIVETAFKFVGQHSAILLKPLRAYTSAGADGLAHRS